MLDKIWAQHLVAPASEGVPAILYVDLHLIHEVTSPQAFALLRERGLRVRRPDRTLATADHSTPTEPLRSGRLPVIDSDAGKQVRKFEENCTAAGIYVRGMGHPERGIVHVIGPELGATQPGMTIVCGDSHTSTHGAFGALAFGIGTTEVAHVLSTQCLLQNKPLSLEVRADGILGPAVSAKDLILAIINRLGISGGTGSVIEYRGSAFRDLSMDARMTVCNMSIEAGARASMVAPDETTFAYLKNRPMAPRGDAWNAAIERWRTLPTDEGARFDRSIRIDAKQIRPMITWGTTPAMSIPVDGTIPSGDEDARRRALDYMGLEGGQPIAGTAVDVVFIGSCTNSRLSDLRAAAGVVRGRRVASGVRMLVVPGSQSVKRQAEAEGLAQAFVDAGAEWRESGCSMCIAMNGDRVGAGKYAISTSNRNFEGRQGPGARTFLASPTTAAAAAVAGRIIDPRDMIN
jgi:3-isopropylmalate/(R)-2-methylmalate dehydratase large subunit